MFDDLTARTKKPGGRWRRVRWTVALVALLLAGCASQAVPPAAAPDDDGVSATAVRVEPTTTRLDRSGAFGLGFCPNALRSCDAPVPVLANTSWKQDVADDAALFWRVNATLAWDRPWEVGLVLRLEALHSPQCGGENDTATCEGTRLLLNIPPGNPARLAGEFILRPGEDGLRVTAAPDYLGSTLEGNLAFLHPAHLEGTILAFRPAGPPVALDVGQG